MKKDKIFISRMNLCIISFLLGLGVFTWSLIVFEQNIKTLGTPKEWKFYASLIGFIGFSYMLLLSTISLVTSLISKKFRDKMKKDGIFLSRKNLCIIGFLFSFSVFLLSLIGFEQNIKTLGTDKEWKFYASLVGFIFVSSMLFVSIIYLAIVLIGKKFTHKLNNVL